MIRPIPEAAVELRTRRLLEELVESGDLDRPSCRLLSAVLERARGAHPGGFVYLVADALGARPDAALQAGALAQLFYAAASFTDDLQDEDRRDALAHLDRRLQLNALAQLLCATATWGQGARRLLGPGPALDVLGATFRAGVAMLTGQRLELAPGRWTTRRYLEVARLSAGRQFEAYLGMAAAAARAPPRTLVAVGQPLGVLLQIHHDLRARDLRLRGFSARALDLTRRRVEREAVLAIAAAPRRARPCLEAFVNPLLVGGAAPRGAR